VALFRYRSDLEAFWTLAVGPVKTRDKFQRTLEKAARSIETLFEGRNDVDEQAVKIGRIPPTKLVEELRLYGRALNLAGSIAKELKVRSLEQFSLYLLSSYVDGATDTPHDSDVARLIGEINDKRGYSSEAHQRWRGRNMAELHSHISSLFLVTEFLVGVGRVIRRPT
jgi:hypothetical protein